MSDSGLLGLLFYEKFVKCQIVGVSRQISRCHYMKKALLIFGEEESVGKWVTFSALFLSVSYTFLTLNIVL